MHRLIILEKLCDPPVIVNLRDTWIGSLFVGRNVPCLKRFGLPKPVHKAVKFCMNFGNKRTHIAVPASFKIVELFHSYVEVTHCGLLCRPPQSGLPARTKGENALALSSLPSWDRTTQHHDVYDHSSMGSCPISLTGGPAAACRRRRHHRLWDRVLSPARCR